MDKVTLPNGIVLTKGAKVNYRNTLAQMRKGTIANFKDVGDHGWMCVLDDKSKSYEDVSIAVQLQHVGEENILIAEKVKKAD